MNKKFGIAAVMVGVMVVIVLVFTYDSNAGTNPPIQNQQPAPNTTTNLPPTTGRHFFANANESITITTNP